MPDHPVSNPAQFIQGAPVLHVRDVMAMVGYFRDVLGFRFDFGDDRYAVVCRDNSAVHFLKAAQDPIGIHLFQWIRDVDRYLSEISARDANITSGPVNTDYGTREFTVITPADLNIISAQDHD